MKYIKYEMGSNGLDKIVFGIVFNDDFKPQGSISTFDAMGIPWLTFGCHFWKFRLMG